MRNKCMNWKPSAWSDCRTKSLTFKLNLWSKTDKESYTMDLPDIQGLLAWTIGKIEGLTCRNPASYISSHVCVIHQPYRSKSTVFSSQSSHFWIDFLAFLFVVVVAFIFILYFSFADTRAYPRDLHFRFLWILLENWRICSNWAGALLVVTRLHAIIFSC